MAVFKLIFMKEGKSKATIINVIIMVQFLKEHCGIRTSIPSVFQTLAIDQTTFEISAKIWIFCQNFYIRILCSDRVYGL